VHRRLVDIITAAAVIAIVAVALPMAALASQPSSNSPSTNTQKALAFSHCMRAHGVRKFPDPYSSGVIPKVSLQQLGVSSSAFQAAEKACQNLLPPGGSNDQFPPGEAQQLLIGMLRFSECMRSHGLPNWPDPTIDSAGQPEFPLSTAHGINPHPRPNLPPFAKPIRECRHVMPSALQGIPLG
jgi:hypothetical protein